MNLSEFFDGVYLPLKLRGKSQNTVRLYRYSVKKFGMYLGRTSELSDLTDLQVSTYLCWLGDQGLSPFSVEKERSQLLAIWNFAAKKGYVKEFPFVERGRLPERIPQAWTRDDLTSLMTALANEPGYISGVKASDWWIAMHKVIWDTGERIGAVLPMEWNWLSGSWVRIPAEVRKGKTRDRMHELSEETVSAIDKIRQPVRKLVFEWDRCPSSLYNRYESILKRAGLPFDSKSKFHRMRRSVASHYTAAGGNASELLDHSSPRITKAYLDPRIVPTSQAKDRLFRIG